MAGESTGLKIIVEDGQAQSLGTIQNPPGLKIQFVGPMSQTTIVNGRRSLRHILNFEVTATEPGSYTIPSVPVIVGGTTHETESLPLTVTPNEVPPDSPYAFVRLTIPKEQIYVGEIVPLEIQLYVAGGGDELQPPELEGSGFVIHKRAPHKGFTTQINNIPYNGAAFRMAISAAKAGQLQLGPAEISFVLRVPLQRNPGDPFGIFGPRYQRRPATLKSKAVTLDVLPLPNKNVPASFTGAIGQFNWEVEGGPTNLNAGDPVTLKILVRGAGNWDSVKLPELNWPGFNVYPPNSTVQSEDPLGIRGEKRFEQVVAPEHSGVTNIPPLALSFFDPVEKAYRTLSSPATPLSVKSTGSPQIQPTLSGIPQSPAEEELPPTDIVHIKPYAGTLQGFVQPVIWQPWFWILQAVPIFVLVGSTLWRRHQDRLERDPRCRRKLEVRRLIAHGLGELKDHSQHGRPDEFYATAFRLLQEQLGDRLDMPAYAITEAVLDEKLPAKGASTELLAWLHQFFQRCNQARYAPSAASGDMTAMLPEMERAFRELQELPD